MSMAVLSIAAFFVGVTQSDLVTSLFIVGFGVGTGWAALLALTNGLSDT